MDIGEFRFNKEMLVEPVKKKMSEINFKELFSKNKLVFIQERKPERIFITARHIHNGHYQIDFYDYDGIMLSYFYDESYINSVRSLRIKNQDDFIIEGYYNKDDLYNIYLADLIPFDCFIKNSCSMTFEDRLYRLLYVMSHELDHLKIATTIPCYSKENLIENMKIESHFNFTIKIGTALYRIGLNDEYIEIIGGR